MDASKPMERRAVTRTSANTIEPVRLRLDDGEFVASVLDISVLGIGMRMRRHLQPGTWLALEPAKSSLCLTPALKAEVRHVRECDQEDYLVGCRFSRPLTVDDMAALG